MVHIKLSKLLFVAGAAASWCNSSHAALQGIDVHRFEPGGWGAFLGVTRHPTNTAIW
jgi:hypothetical protein